MSRLIRGLAIAIGLTALGAVGLAWARPAWRPGWARAGFDRVEAFTRSVGVTDDDEDEKKPAASAARPAELIDDGYCEARERFAGGQAAPLSECRKLLPVVRLSSPGVAKRIGLETAAVTSETHAHRLFANAETAYDAQRTAEVIPRVGGVLREVKVDLGQTVKRGDVLAVVDSAQVGAGKANYLSAKATVGLARVTYERTLKLAQAKATPAKTELEDLTALTRAETTLRDAEQQLRNLGFDDDALARIAREKDTKSFLEIVSPIDGTVITWDATRGEAVEPTTQLFALADTRRVWLWVDVYEADIVAVRAGQAVTFVISGTTGPEFSGEVTWTGSEVNPLTRTTRVRASLPNPDGRLRANQFGRASVRVGEPHEAVFVPRSAVQNAEGADFVFLAAADGGYRPQRVVTRPAETADRLEVVWGLKPGQTVVTTRSYTLKTEMYRDRLGAADND